MVVDDTPTDLHKTQIFKLLSGFKLQQYANKMSSQGFQHDIYKLAFLSHREREELVLNLNMLPGHRDKMFDLFRIIEQLNPKKQLKQALVNAMKS